MAGKLFGYRRQRRPSFFLKILRPLSLWILLSGMLNGQTVFVPLSHWIYDVLERWENKSYIDNVYDHTKPYTRSEIAGYLLQVYHAYQRDPGRLTRFDRQYLEYCASEFAEELSALKAPLTETTEVNRFRHLSRTKPLKYIWPNFLYKNNRNFFAKQYKEFSLYLDPILQYTRSRTLTSNTQLLTAADTLAERSVISNGLLFHGSLGKWIGFYFMLVDNHMNQEPGFPLQEVLEESGIPYHTVKGSASLDFDENAAYFTFANNIFSLMAGRDYNQWGAGHRGQLMLSTNAPIYDQLKLTIKYWRFKFTHIHAFMMYIPPEGRVSIKSTEPVDMYWAGTRLDFYLGKGLQLGLSQSIVYGNQSIKLGYFNPLSFFKSAEHFYGDRDNGALGFDVAWRIRRGFKIFGEWFIDDITVSKLGSAWFGNKFGWQGGFLWTDPFRFTGSDILLEYTRIKPYVYSHSLQDYNKYKHYDTVLGHYIGPNSDDWYIRLRKFPHRRLRLQLDLEAYRHGKNLPDRNVGGDPDLPKGPDDANDVTFLDGELIKRTALGGELRYELLRNTFLSFQYHRLLINTDDDLNTFGVRISYNFGQRMETVRPFDPVTE